MTDKNSKPEYKLARKTGLSSTPITKDGHTMFPEDVVKDLKSFQYKVERLELELKRFKESTSEDSSMFPIPEGWHLLEEGQAKKDGDKYWDGNTWFELENLHCLAISNYSYFIRKDSEEKPMLFDGQKECESCGLRLPIGSAHFNKPCSLRKTEPKHPPIPDGFRLLESGEKVEVGDKYWDGFKWMDTDAVHETIQEGRLLIRSFIPKGWRLVLEGPIKDGDMVGYIFDEREYPVNWHPMTSLIGSDIASRIAGKKMMIIRRNDDDFICKDCGRAVTRCTCMDGVETDEEELSVPASMLKEFNDDCRKAAGLEPEPPRFRVETNLVQWHVIDSSIEPPGCSGVGSGDAHSVAFFQRNQLGDEVCKQKAEHLCNLLNGIHAPVAGSCPSRVEGLLSNEFMRKIEMATRYNNQGNHNKAISPIMGALLVLADVCRELDKEVKNGQG